jgi:hypothetical protein
MARLGFTCHDGPRAATVGGTTALQAASALLGGTGTGTGTATAAV